MKDNVRKIPSFERYERQKQVDACRVDIKSAVGSVRLSSFAIGVIAEAMALEARAWALLAQGKLPDDK